MKTKDMFPWLAASALIVSGVPLASAQAEQPASVQDSQPVSASQVIEEWPETSKKVAKTTMEKYGEPDGVTDTRLVWHDSGPWVRTVVYREEIQHNFPVPHKDVLEQFINYEVPVEKFTELAEYDGSVVAYRTNGELSARCDKEGANFLALNLAHDIIEGTRSVEDARAHYAETMQQVMQGEQPEIVQGLQFETRTASATADPDEQYQQSAAAMSTATGESATATTATADSRELTGSTVVTIQGEEIGEITEVSGDTATISVNDGFLGLGETEVTVPVSELQMSADGEVRTMLTREELESMQAPASEVDEPGDDMPR